MCPYAFYKEIENYNRKIIYCKKKNEVCPFTRFCGRQGKIIPSESMKDCLLRNEINIPNNACFVRKSMSDENYLYVDIEIDGKLFTHKLKNPYDYVPNYVYVYNSKNGYKIRNRKLNE